MKYEEKYYKVTKNKSGAGTVYYIRRSITAGKNGLHRYNVRAHGTSGRKLSAPVYYIVYAKNYDDAFRRMKKGEGIDR